MENEAYESLKDKLISAELKKNNVTLKRSESKLKYLNLHRKKKANKRRSK